MKTENNLMKILLVTDTYENQICGIETSIRILKHELLSLGHDVRVLLLSSNRTSKIVENDYMIGSFSIRQIDVRQPLKFRDKIIDKIISWNPDIVHIQTELFNGHTGVKIAHECSCPYINTSHTTWNEFTRGIIPNATLRKHFSKKLLSKNYRNSSAIIVPSEKRAKILLENNVTLPIHIIPTGLDLKIFNQSFDVGELKSKLDLDNDSKILIFIGRIGPEKNLDELIDYFTELILKDNNFRLIIVGDGIPVKKLKKMVRKLKIDKFVRFTGEVNQSEISKYYKLGDVFVSPSTCETQGLTYMEALASSLPLVCRYDESLDNVIENGYNGFTYTSKKEFIDCILKVFSDYEFLDELSVNALESSKKYTKEKFATDVEKIYLDVLSQKK